MIKTMTNLLTTFWTKRASDGELLETFGKYLDRVDITTHHISDEDGKIIGQVVSLTAGDLCINSDVKEFGWPLVLDGVDVDKKDLH